MPASASRISRPTPARSCSPSISINYVPIIGLIRRVLDERPSHTAPAARFRNELEDYMSRGLCRRDAEDDRVMGPLRRAVRL